MLALALSRRHLHDQKIEVEPLKFKQPKAPAPYMLLELSNVTRSGSNPPRSRVQLLRIQPVQQAQRAGLQPRFKIQIPYQARLWPSDLGLLESSYTYISI
eukprot:TRINITY_DN7450_c1_g1_i1.p1 TRINITY_DN7450_c1_g1~~TRINITY_DN7450_c1_g1_i1.p1  ORF type:complete len:100 (-),score=11.29 TRINITY_DN7450_c1_g1_i1:1931-2230(-)